MGRNLNNVSYDGVIIKHEVYIVPLCRIVSAYVYFEAILNKFGKFYEEI